MSKAAAAIDIAPAAGGSPRPAGGVPTAVSADLMQLPSERMSRLMLSLVALVVAFVRQNARTA